MHIATREIKPRWMSKTKFAAWAETYLSRNSTTKQIQKMLNTEFGGMNEVLVDLYADTGDHALAEAFAYASIITPSSIRSRVVKTILAGIHGNTQVPKMLGELMRYIYTGDKRRHRPRQFFWDAS